jgi:hypothetical protein
MQAGSMASAENKNPILNPCARAAETTPTNHDNAEPGSEDDEEVLCAKFNVAGGNAAELLKYNEDGLDGLDSDDEESNHDDGVHGLALKLPVRF